MIIIELIYNLAILISISILAGFIENRWKKTTVTGATLLGLLFGAAAVIGMLNPFVYAPGIIFDGRSVVLSLCGLFFGPLSAVVAASISLIYRLHLGGTGALMGISVIVSSTLIGILAFYFRRKREIKTSWLFLLEMGLLVHAVMIGLMIWLPSNIRLETLKTISLTVLGIYPLATLLIGKILSDQEVKNRLIEEILLNEKNTAITLMSIGDAVITTDLEGKITRMNSMAEQITGWTLSEVKGLPFGTVFFISDFNNSDQLTNPVMKVLESRAKVELSNHMVLINRHGNEFHISDSAAPIVDEKNEICGVILVFSNITEKHLAEKELSRERNLLRTVIDSLPFSIFVKDRNLKKLLANKTELEFSNRRMEEVIGKDDFELYPDEMAERFRNDDLQVIEKGIPIIDKKEYHSMDQGEKQWFSTTKVPWKDEEGKIIGLVGFGANISGKIDDEEKIRVLSEAIKQSPISIIITCAEGKIEYINPGFEKMTGYLLGSVKGRIARILKKKNTSEKIFNEIWTTIQSGKKWEGEYISKRKSGDMYWESVIIAPIFDIQHAITHFIIVTEDITERKALINELIATKEKAIESDKLKSAFLANMSHEIRTPMNGILGFTELMKIPDLKPADQELYLTMIEQSGNRLLNLINDIIDISKIEAGQIVFTYEKVNLNEMIAMEYQFFQAEAEKKGVLLSVFYGLNNELAFIETDPLRLRQILTNLIKNSIKFTKKGTIEFGYRATETDIEFSVSDQGIGISKELRSTIFERFNQGDLISTRRHEGAGLGLSISQAIVEMLGGRIWVEGREGPGSIFKFTIPRNKPDSPITTPQ